MNNVTRKVRENISAGRLEMQAHKNTLGDTPPGERKKLVVIYSYGGIVDSEELEENETLILPK